MITPLNRFVLLLVFASFLSHGRAAETESFDIVVYGGTSAGIVAGIQAKKMGKTVVVIEPTDREGGLTTGGLGQTDIGNKQVIGGLSREFYERISAHYAKDDAWKWEKREEYRDSGQTRTAQGEATMWTFEPSAALAVYRAWIAETGLKIVFEERLNRESGVKVVDSKIVEITMESGRTFAGKMFIDATYEGDLLAAAGVSYTVGREANAHYGETLNGVQTKMDRHHNFVRGVDPYREKGNPQSGLLPFLDPDGPGEEGGADHRVQAYCYRMCLTDHPENRIPFHQPEGYDEEWFELLLRNFEAGEKGMPWINSSMPNRKTDTNNRTGFSTDFIGQNYDYPDASYAEREEIAKRHLLYQQGLMWTLANHPRVPEAIRSEIAKWGMCKDEFTEGNGWQQQLYVREARRMVSDFVMTQNHCQQKETVSDSVGMGAYTMDSHNTQRYVTAEGFAKNEGDVQVGGFPPYPISYDSIIPKQSECENLLVPVCLSATHIAFGSIRMEPVFMVLAQSAATAASLAIDEGIPIQEVEYKQLQTRLAEDGQILEYTAPPQAAANYTTISSLEGIVVDDSEARLEGPWSPSSLRKGIHQGYYHDGGTTDGNSSATFLAELPKPGKYEVQVAYGVNGNRATNVPVRITHAGGNHDVKLNQREAPKVGRLFTSVGTFPFEKSGKVVISNHDVDGYVVIDAVRWLPMTE
ncbi:MAG: FAD-dependent oxidoreductase [Verrucomicrobiales bacterium]|nr:FAD-dependent oxidoreductase [Verrucomicrobiales bacterium]